MAGVCNKNNIGSIAQFISNSKNMLPSPEPVADDHSPARERPNINMILHSFDPVERSINEGIDNVMNPTHIIDRTDRKTEILKKKSN